MTKTSGRNFRQKVRVSLSLALLAGLPAMAQNILSNSGFEKGLMCYTATIWSNTGVFYTGDYRLSLSTDSHSGNYALQIGCNGLDCFKAAALSNNIPTAPNQSYTLSLWVKCPVGGNPAIYIPGMASGDVFQPLSCNGAWNFNSVSFQTPPTGSEFFFYLFDYATQDGTGTGYGTNIALFDDVTLTYGDGTAGPATLLHPGTRNVSVASNAVMVDGAPYIAMGFFFVDQASLPAVAAMGANTIFGLGPESNAACFNTTQGNYLDQVYDLKMNFVPDSSSTSRLQIPGLFPGLMQQYAPHLANIAWMLADEPDQTLVPYWYTPAPAYLANYEAAKSQTALPLVADLQHAAWAPASYDAPYSPALDFFIAEPYGPDFSFLLRTMSLLQSFPPARPIWLIQDDPGAALIVPKAYAAVAAGATGIGYFNWPAFQADPPAMAAAQRFFLN